MTVPSCVSFLHFWVGLPVWPGAEARLRALAEWGRQRSVQVRESTQWHLQGNQGKLPPPLGFPGTARCWLPPLQDQHAVQGDFQATLGFYNGLLSRRVAQCNYVHEFTISLLSGCVVHTGELVWNVVALGLSSFQEGVLFQPESLTIKMIWVLVIQLKLWTVASLKPDVSLVCRLNLIMFYVLKCYSLKRS